MSFPHDIRLPGMVIPIHLVCEALAYGVGFRLYVRARRRQLSAEQAVWTLVGCLFGAWLGSKLLAWLETPTLYWRYRANPLIWLEGKSIVGGLLGGWAGVEVAKRLTGVRQATGDAYVTPLIVGIAIGRVGCFLTGLTDGTCGVATDLWWGVDFGDGLPRHPTQLYEIAYLAALGATLRWMASADDPPGAMFRRFLLGYFGFRLTAEFIKPRPFLYPWGLTAIQTAALLGMGAAGYDLWRLGRQPRNLMLSPLTGEGECPHG
ncbi:MAG: diacylglyceryl transferase [Chloracidobacterium sp. CP2_5A]|nr:MAG: diacylglyceryl transferase [Chloracidobacterium sp. CP2_5A]